MKKLTLSGWKKIKVRDIFWNENEQQRIFLAEWPNGKRLVDNTGTSVKNPLIMSAIIEAACILAWRR